MITAVGLYVLVGTIAAYVWGLDCGFFVFSAGYVVALAQDLLYGVADRKVLDVVDKDREYARNLLEDDLQEEPDPNMRIEIVAQLLRKVRNEAVL